MRYGPFDCPVEAGKILSQLHEGGVAANLVTDSAVFGMVRYFIELDDVTQVEATEKILENSASTSRVVHSAAEDIQAESRSPKFFKDFVVFSLLAICLYWILASPLDLLPLFGSEHASGELYLGNQISDRPLHEDQNVILNFINYTLYSILVLFVTSLGLIFLGRIQPFKLDKDFHATNWIALFGIPLFIFLDRKLIELLTPSEANLYLNLAKASAEHIGFLKFSILESLFWLSLNFLVFGIVYQMLVERHSKLSVGIIMTCCAFILCFHAQELNGYILSLLYFSVLAAIRLNVASLKVFLLVIFFSSICFSYFELS